MPDPVATTVPEGSSPSSPVAAVSQPAEAISSPEGVVLSGSQAQEKGSPTTATGASIGGTQPSQEGSTAASPTVTADPELEAKPGFQNLRTAYTDLKTKYESLVASGPTSASESDAYLTVDAPVDNWPIEQQLERFAQELPPYYNKLAWTMVEKHLPEVLPVFLQNPATLPPEHQAALRPLVEASATAILQQYTQLEPEEIGEAIRQYKQARNLSQGFQPSYGTGAAPAQPADIQSLAVQYGLDPANATHFALLSSMVNQSRELQDLKGSVTQLTQGEQLRLAAQSSQTVKGFVDSKTAEIMSKVEVPATHVHVRQELGDRVEWALSRDPVVIAARENLEKFYKQGTPDLKAATSEKLKIEGRLAFHVKAIVEPRLNEIQETERLKTTTSQTQTGVRNIPVGVGTGAPVVPQPTGQRITPDNAADIVLERFRQSKLGRLTP